MPSSLHQQDLCVQIIEAIATHEGIDPLDVSPPLTEVIDTDALDRLFKTNAGHGWIEFAYRGHCVRVESDRTIEIKPETTTRQ